MPNGTTNNLAELTAIKECLLDAVKLSSKDDTLLPMIIHSDSQWAVRVILREYRAKVHLELIQEIRQLMDTLVDVKIVWVRGHSGQAYNELVDRMANLATYDERTRGRGIRPRETFLEEANLLLRNYESIKQTT
jgi:ribonuclease HI